MAGLMYMATRTRGEWVACPSVSMPSGKTGFATGMDYLNGGAFIRSSVAAHKNYELSWNMITRDQARPVLDLADGLWGQGEVYFLDPFAMDRNLLSQSWASPFQSGYDGIPLNGAGRPTLVATGANDLGYPVQSAQYTVATATVKPNIWVPVPAGYTAWVGLHGSSGTGGTVTVQPTANGSLNGSATTLTPLSVTTTTRVNASFVGGANRGIQIALGGNGTITLSGLIVQVLPTGATPATGGFISGQGNSGCKFSSQPSYTPYSAGVDRVGMSIALTETGMWA